MRLSLFFSIIVITATRGLATGADDFTSEEGQPLPEESQNDRHSFPRGYAEPERLAKSAGISWATGWVKTKIDHHANDTKAQDSDTTHKTSEGTKSLQDELKLLHHQQVNSEAGESKVSYQDSHHSSRFDHDPDDDASAGGKAKVPDIVHPHDHAA